MASNSINFNPSLLKLFEDNKIESFKDFFLLDVGASGGIEQHWFTLSNKLKAIGFDPLVSEIKRLNQQNTNSNVSYVEGFVTYNQLNQKFPLSLRNDLVASLNNFSQERSSSVRAIEAKNYNYIQKHYNTGEALVYSDQYFELDDYFRDNSIETVDFIKIDTDGHDFPVLLGAQEVLDQKGVLGLSVECWFHGSTHSYANTFSNIDQFLRSKGFSLFNLDAYKYSRSTLPRTFAYDIYAQTQNGPVQWGEAVYFRDIADKNYEKKFDFKVTKQRIFKLAFLYELFGLNDCAAELLLLMHEKFNFSNHLNLMLDCLTPLIKKEKVSYQDYVQQFDKNPDLWFPEIDNLNRFNRLKGFLNSSPFLKNSKFLKILKKIYHFLKK